MVAHHKTWKPSGTSLPTRQWTSEWLLQGQRVAGNSPGLHMQQWCEKCVDTEVSPLSMFDLINELHCAWWNEQIYANYIPLKTDTKWAVNICTISLESVWVCMTLEYTVLLALRQVISKINTLTPVLKLTKSCLVTYWLKGDMQRFFTELTKK